MPLTDVFIKSVKPEAKIRRYFDGQGMYLEVSPLGGKYWRLKYRSLGREKRLALGVYPDTSLKDARVHRAAARALMANGIDPGAHRSALKAARIEAASNSFEVIAREWHSNQKAGWKSSHADKIIRRLEMYVLPRIGRLPVAAVKAKDVLDSLRRIEAKGHIETAHRTLNVVNRVLDYAVRTGRAETNPARSLTGALEASVTRHHPTIIEASKVKVLLRRIDAYDGRDVTRLALRLAPLVFLRPGELRQGEWSEIDFVKHEWHIPSLRMKMAEKHIVPLSTQAMSVLKELQAITGGRRLLFPSVRALNRPMSENTLNAALRYMGYAKGEMTTHGFRSLASTLLNERGFHPDAIERQLAHAPRNATRAAYNYAQYMPLRREMMQSFANMLDDMRA